MKHDRWLATLLLVGCSSGPHARRAEVTIVPPACARADAERQRVPRLLAQGRLDRASRVLDHADALCPASAGDSREQRKRILASLHDERSAEALFEAGLKASAAHDFVEMQRMYDRAMRRAEVEAGAQMALELPSTPRDTYGGDEHAFVWSPDSSVFASIAAGEVSIRERRFGFRETRRLGGWSSDVQVTAISPDGKTLAVGTEDKTLRLIDTSTWSETRTLAHRPGNPLSGVDWHPKEWLDVVKFSPDGTHMISGTYDGGWGGSLRLWDVSTGTELLAFDGRTGNAPVVYSPDGKTISTFTPQSGAFKWDATTGQRLTPDSPIPPTADSDLVDETIERWQAKAATHHPYPYRSGVSPDRKHVAVALDDGDRTSLRLLDAATGAEEMTTTVAGTFKSPPWSSFAFSPDGQYVVLDSWHDFAIIDTRTGSVALSPEPSAEPPRGPIALSADGGHLLTAFGTLRLWSLRAPVSVQVVAQADRKDRPFGAIAISPDGRRLAFVASEGSNKIVVWEIATGKQIALGDDTGVASLAFSPDGGTLADGGEKKVRLWDAATGAEKRRLKWPLDSSVERIAFSPDGLSVGATDGSHAIRIWDARSGEETVATDGSAFAFLRQSPAIAVGREANVFLHPPSVMSSPLAGHTEGVTSLAVSADGRVLASASLDGTVRLWDLQRSKEMLRIDDPSVDAVAFLPNRAAVVLSSGGAISFRAFDGKPLVSLRTMGKGDAGFAVTTGAKPLVEPLGWDADIVRGAMRCRAGALVFPYEMCRERFEVPGLLERSISPNGYDDDP